MEGQSVPTSDTGPQLEIMKEKWDMLVIRVTAAIGQLNLETQKYFNSQQYYALSGTGNEIRQQLVIDARAASRDIREMMDDAQEKADTKETHDNFFKENVTKIEQIILMIRYKMYYDKTVSKYMLREVAICIWYTDFRRSYF